MLTTDGWTAEQLLHENASAGVILGYLVFALMVFLLFRVTHQNPHAPAPMGFEITAIVYGVFFAFLAGYWGTAIGGRRDMWVAAFIAVIMAAFAIVVDGSRGVAWSPLSALVLMVPAELVGGYVRATERNKNHEYEGRTGTARHRHEIGSGLERRRQRRLGEASLRRTSTSFIFSACTTPDALRWRRAIA